MTTGIDVKATDAAILRHASDVVASYLAQNRLPVQELPNFIRMVYTTMKELEATPSSKSANKPVPAVDPKRSLHDDYIICLEDGARMKSLKRYLARKYNMTPRQYREKWGLPGDYPMVCKSHSRKRSEMARRIGLGRTISKTADADDAASAEAAEAPPT